MKRLFFLSLLLSIGLVLHSKTFSELTIRIERNLPFYVVFDGRNYDGYYGEVKIRNIEKGYHYLEVFRQINLHGGFSFDCIYSGKIDIRPNKKIFAKIDNFGRFITERIVNINNSYYNNGNHYGNYGNNYDDDSYNENIYENYYIGMSTNTFGSLKAMMYASSFDNDKLILALRAIEMNGISCEQLIVLMGIMTFDSNRLDLAKFAYSRIVDKNNVFIIYSAFTFRSNAENFYSYIGL